MQYRKAPPILRSAERTGVVNPFGPHHFFISPGSVHAFHTRSRGASKLRVVTSPLSSALRRSLCPPACLWLVSAPFGSCTSSPPLSLVPRPPYAMPAAAPATRSPTV